MFEHDENINPRHVPSGIPYVPQSVLTARTCGLAVDGSAAGAADFFDVGRRAAEGAHRRDNCPIIMTCGACHTAVR